MTDRADRRTPENPSCQNANAHRGTRPPVGRRYMKSDMACVYFHSDLRFVLN